jgi:hypothetical protein
MVFYATSSGGQTLDVGDGGGNPFASALIEAARESELRSLAARLRELTAAKSGGVQLAESAGDAAVPTWRFAEDMALERERRVALVLVVSDYSGLRPGAELVGAALDERRIAAMLAQRGFSVEQGVGPTRAELVQALAAFRRRSRRADVGVVYSTGHGIDVDGVVYLLPGDYPLSAGFGVARLRGQAIGVPRMIDAASATKQNLVFFAGCRSHVRDHRVPDLDAALV